MRHLMNKTKIYSAPITRILSKQIISTFLGIALIIPAIAQAADDFQGNLTGVSITDADATNQAPIVKLTYTQDGDTFTFDASNSYDPDGRITKYRWQIGEELLSEGESLAYTFSNETPIDLSITLLDNGNATTIRRFYIPQDKTSVPIEVASEDFNGYNHGTNLESTDNWKVGTGAAVTLYSSSVRGNSGTSHSAAYWVTDSFKDNQYSKVTIQSLAGGGADMQGAIVRYSTSGYYGVRTNGRTVYIFEYDASAPGSEYNNLASITQEIVVGDVIQLEISGTTLKVKLNDVQIGSDTTPTVTLPSGSPGLYFSSSSSSATITEWAGGNL